MQCRWVWSLNFLHWWQQYSFNVCQWNGWIYSIHMYIFLTAHTELNFNSCNIGMVIFLYCNKNWSNFCEILWECLKSPMQAWKKQPFMGSRNNIFGTNWYDFHSVLNHTRGVSTSITNHSRLFHKRSSYLGLHNSAGVADDFLIGLENSRLDAAAAVEGHERRLCGRLAAPAAAAVDWRGAWRVAGDAACSTHRDACAARVASTQAHVRRCAASRRSVMAETTPNAFLIRKFYKSCLVFC